MPEKTNFTLKELQAKQGGSTPKKVFTFDELKEKQDVASKMRESRIKRFQEEADSAKIEADRLMSPSGFIKEFGKDFGKRLGEVTGITPTAKKIAAGIAPAVVPEEELPFVVEELAGGVTSPRPSPGKEFIETAFDLPIISLGLSKNISKFLGEQGVKIAPEELGKFLSKELVDFLPDIFKKDVNIKNIKEKIVEAPSKVKGAISDKIPFRQTRASRELEETLLGGTKKEVIPKQTRKEIVSGIRPDLKKRIAGKAPELNRFFQQSIARNLDDTEISPLALAGEDVDKAFRILEKEISNTGSKIGKFREKISTIKVPVESFERNGKVISGIDNIIQNFDNSLKGKGLEIGKDRVVKKITTRETILSDREIEEVQKIRDMLVRLKGDPTVLRVIDNRNIIQKNLDFAKSAREISNSLDSVGKSLRSDLAKINREAIGKSEAKNLEEFSSLIDLLDEFKSLTSKGKNTEFILKRLLSERDKAPKEIVDKIKEITGIDIQDSAQFSRLAIEILGNEQQKGLFRQEIANAGIDVSDLFSRSRTGAVLRFITDIAKKGKEEVQLRKGLDPKTEESLELAKIFLESAK